MVSHKKIPLVFLSLLTINSIIICLEYWTGDIYPILWEYGMIPRYVLSGQRLQTLFTHMFVHADIFLHFIPNMSIFILACVITRIEEKLGHLRFLLIYIASGICGALLQLMASVLHLTFYFIPVVGSSGAVLGIVGAGIYISIPKDWRTILFLFSLSALMAVTAMDIYSIATSWAHIGGYISGAIISHFLEKKDRGKS